MSKIREFVDKNKIFLLLVVGAIVLLLISAWIHVISRNRIWGNELSKGIIEFSFIILIGAFIQLLLDRDKKRKEQDTKTKENKKQNEAEKKEFMDEILNRLARVVDDVNISRILIASHKSVKTYGDAVRERIIPCAASLEEIGRSLTAAPSDQIEDGDRNRLQIQTQSMRKYLQLLIDGFERDYLDLSNQQFLHEGYKEKLKAEVVAKFLSNNQEFESVQKDQLKNLEDLNKRLWLRINNLNHVQDFLNDKGKSGYSELFVDPYKECEKILRRRI